MAVIVLDAGHGGFDNGAVYFGRKEKNDNLRLALAVGKLLEEKGYDIVYTRTTDEYQSPYEKAQIGNEADADYFISFHRNSGEDDNTYQGVQTLIFGDNRQAEKLAWAINEELEKTGFANLGIDERPGLVVLRRTRMPAVLIETGFINNDRDNEIFDENFDAIAQAIATAIASVVPLSATKQNLMPETSPERTAADADMDLFAEQENMSAEKTADAKQENMPVEKDVYAKQEGMSAEKTADAKQERISARKDTGLKSVSAEKTAVAGREELAAEKNNIAGQKEPMAENREAPQVFQVETGRFLYESTANFMAEQLEEKGFSAELFEEDGIIHVAAGREKTVDDAMQLQKKLRCLGYSTMIVGRTADME